MNVRTTSFLIFRSMLVCLFLIGITLFSPIALAGFGIHAGSHFGYGKMGNDSQSLADRSLSTFDIQAMPGYSFFGFMPGLMLDYRMHGELEKNTSGGQNDMTGHSFLWGMGLSFEPLLWKFLVGWDFSAKHYLANAEVIYRGSGWRLLVGYQFLPHVFFDFLFSRTRYNSKEVSDIPVNTSQDNLHHWNLAFGASVSF